MAEAFVYCWTDFKTNMLYVGVHKGTPDDGYVCSSKYMKEEYKQRPADFSRQIIAFGTYKEMRVFEIKILKSANAIKNESFYNKTNGDGRFLIIKHSEETKRKMRGPKTESHKQKLRGPRPHVNQSGTKNNAYYALKGSKKSKEWRSAISDGQAKIIWTVISPTDEVFVFRDLKKGRKENNIHISHMRLWYSAKTGIPTKEGWRCFKNASRFDIIKSPRKRK